jgi:5-methylcytosine-specific restriction protein A
MHGTSELCERKELELTVHHLVPKVEGEGLLATARLCKACHKQIHTLYSNKEFAVRL